MSDVQASLRSTAASARRSRLLCFPLRPPSTVAGSGSRRRCTIWSWKAGGYVMLEGGGGSSRLGQVLSLELHSEDATGPGLPQVRIRVGNGEGVVLDGDGRPFHDAIVRTARPEVGAWLDRIRPDRPTLEVGELALARGVPIELDAGGFGRHTFICGQSGSGRPTRSAFCSASSMATNLRVVVLDPNSDYVRLGEPRAEADAQAAERFAPVAGSVAVRSGATGSAPIRVRFRELSPAQQAALLRLDPLADREEYAELTALVEDERVRSLQDLEQVESQALKLGRGTWASIAGTSGPAPRASRSRRSSRMRAGPAASSSTWDRWVHARSRRLPRAPCSSGSGAGERGASRPPS